MVRKDYYIYAHRSVEGTIFYIGKGCGKRAYSKAKRSKAWNKIADTGFSIEILLEGLSNYEALRIESELINNPQDCWNLVNVIGDQRNVEIDVPAITEQLYYSDTSPTFLRWKVDKVSGNGLIKYRAGDVAGSIKSDGYCIVGVNKKYYKVHRVIYTLFNGKIEDGLVINHIDNNPSNNRIENLEMCEQHENSKRTKIHRGIQRIGNVSGVTGVYKSCSDNRYISWVAEWMDSARKCKKRFYVHKHGNEEAFRLACEYRAQKIRELNEQGAGYTDRHGT